MGHGNNGNVMAFLGLNLLIEVLEVRIKTDGCLSRFDEGGAKVFIALFGNSSSIEDLTALVQRGDNADIASQLMSVVESSNITDFSEDQMGGNDTDPWDCV